MTLLRTLGTALRATLVLTLLLGVGYTGAVTLVGALVLPGPAAGSLIERDGEVVGSRLLAQPFTDGDGAPLPRYFQPRPSAAGQGWDAGASGGSNLGPENPDLVQAVRERREGVAALEGVDVDQVPPDAVTASGSGLDPHVSPAYAALQVPRVARERGLTPDAVRVLVAEHTTGAILGYIGESVVNVVTLNLALDELDAPGDPDARSEPTGPTRTEHG